VTTILIVVVGFAIVAGVTWVMMRMERSHRQLIERQREAWRAGGSVGLEPGRWGGSAGGGGFGGGFSPPGG
jgi:hypothetical protein